MFLFRNIYGYFWSVLLITKNMILEIRQMRNVNVMKINIILPGQDFPLAMTDLKEGYRSQSWKKMLNKNNVLDLDHM